MDRRKHPRDEKNIEVKFSIEDKIIKCKMQNISESGALFQIDSNEMDKITQDDIGKEVSIKLKELKNKITRGRIIRVIEEDNIKYFGPL